MRKLTIFFMAVLLTISSLLAQTEVREKIQKIADELAQDNLQYEFIGYSPTSSKQYKKFKKLKRKATIEELYVLCNSTSPTVRCYSFWALADKDKSDGIIKVLIEHLTDKAIVNEEAYDMVLGKTVREFFYTMVMPYESNYNVPKLTDLQKIYVDSVFLTKQYYIKNMNFEERDYFFSKLLPDERYYNLIKEMAIEKNYPCAIFALSKYKKGSDLELISKILDFDDSQTIYWGFRSIMNYPDTSFVKLLEEFQKLALRYRNLISSNAMRTFYKAVASYKNKWARDLMFNSLQNDDPYFKINNDKAIYIACKKFPIPLYEEIINNIHLSAIDSMYVDWQVEVE